MNEKRRFRLAVDYTYGSKRHFMVNTLTRALASLLPAQAVFVCDGCELHSMQSAPALSGPENRRVII